MKKKNQHKNFDITTKEILSIIILSLIDEFEFEEKQIEKLLKNVNINIEALKQRYISFQDVETMISEKNIKL